MLLRHSALYLLARGVPGLVNFFAIAIYTRMLSPEEYGRYALVVAGVGLFNVIFFQWLRLSLLRFLPAYVSDPKDLLSSVLAGFVSVAFLTGVLGVLAAAVWPDPSLRGLLLVAIPLLWAQAWFELNLEMARSRLRPERYGMMSGIKAVSALVLGVAAVFWGAWSGRSAVRSARRFPYCVFSLWPVGVAGNNPKMVIWLHEDVGRLRIASSRNVCFVVCGQQL